MKKFILILFLFSALLASAQRMTFMGIPLGISIDDFTTQMISVDFNMKDQYLTKGSGTKSFDGWLLDEPIGVLVYCDTYIVTSVVLSAVELDAISASQLVDKFAQYIETSYAIRPYRNYGNGGDILIIYKLPYGNITIYSEFKTDVGSYYYIRVKYEMEQNDNYADSNTSINTPPAQPQNYEDDESDDDYEQDDEPYTYKEITYYTARTTADLNLRKGPGTNYKAIERIPRGGYVFISTADEGQPFRKVTYIQRDLDGYVSSKYLTDFTVIPVDENGHLDIDEQNYHTTSDVNVTNNTDKSPTITLGNRALKFSPHQTRTFKDVRPGKYRIICSSPGVIPYIGIETIEAGYIYSRSFVITRK